MLIRTLPATDLNVSSLCFGTTEVGGALPAAGAETLLDAFVAAGGVFIDTAAVYSNWRPGERSASEKTIGRWMKKRGNRRQLVIATKGAHPDMATMHLPRSSPAEIVADLDDSLRHLQTDVIDLYFLHRDDPARPVEEALETLDRQMKLGKIRYFGCSNWRTDRIAAAQAYARRRGMPGFVANQTWWSLAQADLAHHPDDTVCAMDGAMWQFHQAGGMAVMAYSSQAGGYFQKVLAGQPGQSLYASVENEARSRRVLELAAETGLTVTQVVLGYLLSQPFVTIPVVGCKTLAHLHDTLTAAEVTLTPAQCTWLAPPV